MSTTAAKSTPGRTSKSKAAGRPGKGTKTTDASAKPKTASAQITNHDGGKRLSPGALDGLVLGYMKRNRKKLPATSGVVARGIKRSSGAVANCLRRLEEAEKVNLTNKKPRKYDLAVGK